MSLSSATRPVAALCPVPADDTDRSDDLNAWLNDLRPGTIVSLGANEGRTYRVDKSLRLTGLEQVGIIDAALTVGAASSEWRNTRSTRRHLALAGCSDVALDGITVRGQNTTNDAGEPVEETEFAAYLADRETEHGLQVEDSQRVTVTGYRCDGVFGDGLYLRRVTDFTIDGFTITRNGRQGVAATAGRGIRILNGRISSRRAAIDLEPNVATEVIRDVELGHLATNSRLLTVTAGGRGDVSNVYVHDIDNIRSGLPCINLTPAPDSRRDNWLIHRWTNHTPAGSAAPVVRIRDAAGFTLRDFTAPCVPARAMTGLGATNSTVSLANVTFNGAAQLADAADTHLAATDCTPNP